MGIRIILIFRNFSKPEQFYIQNIMETLFLHPRANNTSQGIATKEIKQQRQRQKKSLTSSLSQNYKYTYKFPITVVLTCKPHAHTEADQQTTDHI